MVWQAEDKYDAALKMGAFLISPVLGLCASLLRINTRSSFVVLFAVFVTFGLSMITRNVRSDDFNFDSVAYRQWFEESYDDTLTDFTVRFDEYLHFQNRNMDFYCDAVNFLVSRITHNYHYLFLVVALVFAYFKLKLLKLFVAEKNYHFSVLGLSLLFVFALNQIIEINVYRFYTALIIAVYALFRILVCGNRKYLFLLAVTPFFHGSFVVVYVLWLLYYLLRSYWKFVVPIGIGVSLIFIFFPSLMASLLIDAFAYVMPDVTRFARYTDVFYMREINESGTGFVWVQRILEHGTWIMMDATIAFYAFQYKNYIKGSKCEELFKFLLILIFFVNSTIFIPSLGSRFLMMVFPMVAYIYLVCFSSRIRKHIGVYLLVAFYLCCMLMPWAVYQIPCLKFYTQLWEPRFWVMSPLYSVVRYLIVAVV